MVQGKINRGRYTDHPAGCQSIQTNQCPPPPSHIFYRPDALPAAQPCQSTVCLLSGQHKRLSVDFHDKISGIDKHRTTEELTRFWKYLTVSFIVQNLVGINAIVSIILMVCVVYGEAYGRGMSVSGRQRRQRRS